MQDTHRQIASGKVLWHLTMSLDGFVAGPGHAMDWMTGFTVRPGLIEEYVETTGAVLGGRVGGTSPSARTTVRAAVPGKVRSSC